LKGLSKFIGLSSQTLVELILIIGLILISATNGGEFYKRDFTWTFSAIVLSIPI